MMVSGAWGDPALHMYRAPPNPAPPRRPHDTEQSPLCFTTGPCWLPSVQDVSWRRGGYSDTQTAAEAVETAKITLLHEVRTIFETVLHFHETL